MHKFRKTYEDQYVLSGHEYITINKSTKGYIVYKYNLAIDLMPNLNAAKNLALTLISKKED